MEVLGKQTLGYTYVPASCPKVLESVSMRYGRVWWRLWETSASLAPFKLRFDLTGTSHSYAAPRFPPPPASNAFNKSTNSNRSFRAHLLANDRSRCDR